MWIVHTINVLSSVKYFLFFLEYSSNKISISKLVMQKNISRKVLNKVKLTKLMKILLLQHYSMNFFLYLFVAKKKL